MAQAARRTSFDQLATARKSPVGEKEMDEVESVGRLGTSMSLGSGGFCRDEAELKKDMVEVGRWGAAVNSWARRREVTVGARSRLALSGTLAQSLSCYAEQLLVCTSHYYTQDPALLQRCRRPSHPKRLLASCQRDNSESTSAG